MGKENDKPAFLTVRNIEAKDKDSEQECIDAIRNLSDNQAFAVLATHDDGGPFTSLVAFAAGRDLKHIIFITPKNTTKYNNIMMNRNITLLIDNRSDRPESINQISSLTVTGSAQVLSTGDFISSWADVYLEKHPNLSDFADLTSNAAILVEVGKYVYVSKFQQVIEWYPD